MIAGEACKGKQRDGHGVGERVLDKMQFTTGGADQRGLKTDTPHTDTRLVVVHDGGGSGGGCDGRTNLATEARHESPSSLLFIVSASHARETDIAWGFAQ